MKIEGIKKILKRKKSVIVGCVIFLLIIFVLVEYVILVNNTYKALAPENSNFKTNIDNKTKSYNETDDSNALNENSDQSVDNLPSNTQEGSDDAQYYINKSEAEYTSGNKEEALKTVIDGLTKNPDDELLKAKKDILEKDYINSDVDALRQ